MGYRGKLHEQQRARELRAHGWAIPDIAEELGVAKSSVSLWTRDVHMPEEARQRRRRKARPQPPNKLQRAKQDQIDRLVQEGRRTIGELAERDLFIAGVALYAGEGSKTGAAVGFSNTDPTFISLFCTWLRRYFTIDESRLRINLYLHQGLDLDLAIAHWVAVTGVPRTQFRKPYRAVPDSSIRTTKHPFGCVTVEYSCTATHRAILALVNGLLHAPFRDDYPWTCAEARPAYLCAEP